MGAESLKTQVSPEVPSIGDTDASAGASFRRCVTVLGLQIF